MKLRYTLVILFSTIAGADIQNMAHGNIYWHTAFAMLCYSVACIFMDIGARDPKEFNK
jgi:hypothetical protein